MADAVVLEFTGIGPEQYWAVNELLDVDMATGTGDWPDGLVAHVAGTADDGSLVVTEVWSSREAQAAFMEERLGSALARAGVVAPPKVTWISVVAHQSPGN